VPELNQQQQSEKLFRLLVEGVRDYAIFMLDPDGHVASWNLGAERIKGYSREDILGRHFSIFYGRLYLRSGKPGR
jgi:PAS domain S-box-containing protein